MGALTFSPAVLGALGAPRAPLPAQAPRPASATTLTTQDLAQSLFQRALQTAAQLPVAEPVTGGNTLAQEVTASLLAALNAPQAATDASTIPTATTNPTPVQATDSTSPTVTPAVTPLTTPDLPVVQDAAALSATPDFALGTALRFGAGVAALAGPAVTAADFGSGLLRDATGVLRTDPLEPRAGSPGQEAFTASRTGFQRLLRSYEVLSSPTTTLGNNSLDLLA
jgi:hypothetical protein